MPGCRALKKPEIVKILASLKSPRDRALFTLGLSTGFRISELLSLQVSDVFQFGAVVDRVRVRAMYMKGKDKTREVILNESAKSAIMEIVQGRDNGPLFKSREGDGAISRRQANQILKDAFNQLELHGKLATHSMRKTFAETVHKALGENIYKTAKAMGHKSIDSTAKYLSVDQDEIDAAILKG
jgi:site-specific recombinase XerD